MAAGNRSFLCFYSAFEKRQRRKVNLTPDDTETSPVAACERILTASHKGAKPCDIQMLSVAEVGGEGFNWSRGKADLSAVAAASAPTAGGESGSRTLADVPVTELVDDTAAKALVNASLPNVQAVLDYLKTGQNLTKLAGIGNSTQKAVIDALRDKYPLELQAASERARS